MCAETFVRNPLILSIRAQRRQPGTAQHSTALQRMQCAVNENSEIIESTFVTLHQSLDDYSVQVYNSRFDPRFTQHTRHSDSRIPTTKIRFDACVLHCSWCRNVCTDVNINSTLAWTDIRKTFHFLWDSARALWLRYTYARGIFSSFYLSLYQTHICTQVIHHTRMCISCGAMGAHEIKK